MISRVKSVNYIEGKMEERMSNNKGNKMIKVTSSILLAGAITLSTPGIPAAVSAIQPEIVKAASMMKSTKAEESILTVKDVSWSTSNRGKIVISFNETDKAEELLSNDDFNWLEVVNTNSKGEETKYEVGGNIWMSSGGNDYNKLELTKDGLTLSDGETTEENIITLKGNGVDIKIKVVMGAEDYGFLYPKIDSWEVVKDDVTPELKAAPTVVNMVKENLMAGFPPSAVSCYKLTFEGEKAEKTVFLKAITKVIVNGNIEYNPGTANKMDNNQYLAKDKFGVTNPDMLYLRDNNEINTIRIEAEGYAPLEYTVEDDNTVESKLTIKSIEEKEYNGAKYYLVNFNENVNLEDNYNTGADLKVEVNNQTYNWDNTYGPINNNFTMFWRDGNEYQLELGPSAFNSGSSNTVKITGTDVETEFTFGEETAKPDAPTAKVVVNKTGEVTVTGEGVVGTTITVKNGEEVIASQELSEANYSIDITEAAKTIANETELKVTATQDGKESDAQTASLDITPVKTAKTDEINAVALSAEDKEGNTEDSIQAAEAELTKLKETAKDKVTSANTIEAVQKVAVPSVDDVKSELVSKAFAEAKAAYDAAVKEATDLGIDIEEDKVAEESASVEAYNEATEKIKEKIRIESLKPAVPKADLNVEPQGQYGYKKAKVSVKGKAEAGHTIIVRNGDVEIGRYESATRSATNAYEIDITEAARSIDEGTNLSVVAVNENVESDAQKLPLDITPIKDDQKKVIKRDTLGINSGAVTSDSLTKANGIFKTKKAEALASVDTAKTIDAVEAIEIDKTDAIAQLEGKLYTGAQNKIYIGKDGEYIQIRFNGNKLDFMDSGDFDGIEGKDIFVYAGVNYATQEKELRIKLTDEYKEKVVAKAVDMTKNGLKYEIKKNLTLTEAEKAGKTQASIAEAEKAIKDVIDAIDKATTVTDVKAVAIPEKSEILAKLVKIKAAPEYKTNNYGKETENYFVEIELNGNDVAGFLNAITSVKVNDVDYSKKTGMLAKLEDNQYIVTTKAEDFSGTKVVKLNANGFKLDKTDKVEIAAEGYENLVIENINVKTADKEALKAAIAHAEEVMESIKYKHEATEGQKTQYAEAVEEAKAINENSRAAQSEADTIIKTLEAREAVLDGVLLAPTVEKVAYEKAFDPMSKGDRLNMVLEEGEATKLFLAQLEKEGTKVTVGGETYEKASSIMGLTEGKYAVINNNIYFHTADKVENVEITIEAPDCETLTYNGAVEDALGDAQAAKLAELDKLVLTEEDKKGKTEDSIKAVEDKIAELKNQVNDAQTVEAVEAVEVPTMDDLKDILVDAVEKESPAIRDISFDNARKAYMVNFERDFEGMNDFKAALNTGKVEVTVGGKNYTKAANLGSLGNEQFAIFSGRLFIKTDGTNKVEEVSEAGITVKVAGYKLVEYQQAPKSDLEKAKEKKIAEINAVTLVPEHMKLAIIDSTIPAAQAKLDELKKAAIAEVEAAEMIEAVEAIELDKTEAINLLEGQLYSGQNRVRIDEDGEVVSPYVSGQAGVDTVVNSMSGDYSEIEGKELYIYVGENFVDYKDGLFVKLNEADSKKVVDKAISNTRNIKNLKIDKIALKEDEKAGMTEESIKAAEAKLEELKKAAKKEVADATTIADIKAVEVDKSEALNSLEKLVSFEKTPEIKDKTVIVNVSNLAEGDKLIVHVNKPVVRAATSKTEVELVQADIDKGTKEVELPEVLVENDRVDIEVVRAEKTIATATETVDKNETPTPKPKPSRPSRGGGGGNYSSVSSKRIAGNSRVATAVEVSKNIYANGTKNVVIANMNQFADVLTATPLAAQMKAPILFVNSDSIPQETMNEIKRLGAKNVTIIGGENSVSKSVEKQLEGKTIERIAGSDRYETSVKIAEKVREKGSKSVVEVANGAVFADGLSMSSLAIKQNAPIVLVQRDNLPASVLKAVSSWTDVKTVNIAGMHSSVSGAAEKVLASKVKVNRYGGADRYETAAKIAKAARPTATTAVYTSGEKFADALVAGPLAAKKSAPILLVKKNAVPASITEYTKRVNNIYVVGGESTVEQTVIERLLKIAK